MTKEKPFKKFHLKLSIDTARYHGLEPSWESGQVNESNYNGLLGQTLNWYNYCTDKKQGREFLGDYIKVFRTDTADTDLKLLNRVSDKNLCMTAAALARMMVQGFPLNDKHKSEIWAHIQSASEKKQEIEEVKPATERIGVQERMDIQVGEVFNNIEDIVQNLLNGKTKDAKSNNVVGLSKFSAIHFKKLGKLLEPTINELTELQSHRADKPDDDWSQQLLEAYEYASNKSIKAAIAFLEDCQGLANKLAIEKKVQRVRKKKPTDRAKLVSKFKFMPEFAELKLTSAKPVDILGASEVWVYDTKKRKLGVYRSEFANSIMIKGTTLVGVREKTCIQKTLRKPATQLGDFMKLNKNQLNKWFSEVKGTEHQMKPRSNENLVILKIVN